MKWLLLLLQECATYFLECGHQKIKNAMIALLVEILLPVAAVINLEASLPVAKKFVNMLYNHCVEQAKRARHSSVSKERRGGDGRGGEGRGGEEGGWEERGWEEGGWEGRRRGGRGGEGVGGEGTGGVGMGGKGRD